MFCPKCGNNLSESASFCTNCGKKLDVPKTPVPSAPASEPATVASTETTPAVAPAPSRENSASASSAPSIPVAAAAETPVVVPAPKRSVLPFAIVGGALLVAVVAIGAAWGFVTFVAPGAFDETVVEVQLAADGETPAEGASSEETPEEAPEEQTPSVPMVSVSTTRYATCEELVAKLAEAMQGVCNAANDPQALVANRTALAELYPDEALGIMMAAVGVESVDGFAALLGADLGASELSSVSDFESYQVQVTGSVGNAVEADELAALNEQVHAAGMTGTVTAANEVELSVRVAGTTAEASAAAQQMGTATATFEVVEIDGSWCVSPVPQLSDVMAAAQETSEAEWATCMTTGVDGAPILAFSYPAAWESSSRVYEASDTMSNPFGKDAEQASIWSEGNEGWISLYYIREDVKYYDNVAVVTKIRDVPFDLSVAASGGRTESGPYVVAEVTGLSEGGLESWFQVVPESFVGEHDMSYLQAGSTLPFALAGQSLDFGGYASADNLEARQLVVESLASLKIAS